MGSFPAGERSSEAAYLKTAVVTICLQHADVSWQSEGSSRHSFQDSCLAAVASAQLDCTLSEYSAKPSDRDFATSDPVNPVAQSGQGIVLQSLWWRDTPPTALSKSEPFYVDPVIALR
jgi:hypothetical protein